MESYDPSGFVNHQPGNVPIILTSPHGGKLELPNVAERTGKGYCNVLDSNTNVIVDGVMKEFATKYPNVKPYFVQGLAHRKYCDLNRHSTYQQKEAAPYYDYYHNTIKNYISEMKTQFPDSNPILLDVHGQSLRQDEIFRGTCDGKTHPFLLKKHGFEAIVGKNSILGNMQKCGIKIFPECSVPYGTEPFEEKNYNGGLTVQYYSGLNYDFNNPIDCIQMEIGRSYRKPKTYPKNIQHICTSLTESISIFLDHFFFLLY